MSTRFLLISTLVLLVVIGLYAFFILQPYTQCFSADGAPSALGLTFGYDRQSFIHFFSVRSEAQLTCYLDFLKIWDMIFPFVYASLFLIWFRFLFSQKSILLLPLILVAADISENFHELSMLQTFSSTQVISVESIQLGSVLTQLKWTLVGLHVLLMTTGILRKIVKYRKIMMKSGK